MSTQTPSSLPAERDWAFFRRSLILGLVAALGLIAWNLYGVLLLLFASILIAVLIRAIARQLIHYLRFPEGVATAVTALVLVAAIGAVAWFFGRQIAGQLGEVAGRLPQAFAAAKETIGLPDMTEPIKRQLGSATGAIVGGLTTFTFGVFGALTDLVIVFIAAIYLAYAPQLYQQGVVRLFPHKQRGRIRDTMMFSGNALELWIGAQLIAMALIFVIYAVGLSAIGVPAALGLALIAGLLEFIPVLGSILGAVPAILVALTVDVETALWTLAFTVAVQQIEGNLIVPLITRRMVRLPPALTLFAVLAFASLFGVLGLFLAAPLLVLAYVAVKKLYVRDVLGDETQIPGENK